MVDSPPGAGKSTLVVRAAAELARKGERVMIVGQTNEQVDDLIDRLATDNPDTPIGRLSAAAYTPSERVAGHQNVAARSSVADLADHPVVVATAAKWAVLKDVDNTWPWAIVDEAYQMRSDALLRVARLFDRALFVGDPGQLDPFSTVETERWLGLNWDPMSSAVAVLLANNSHIPVAHAAGLLAAARLRRDGGVGGVLPLHRVPVGDRGRRPADGVEHATVRARLFDLPWRPRRGPAGRCSSSATGTRCRPTREAVARLRRAGRRGCCSAARSRSRSGRPTRSR